MICRVACYLLAFYCCISAVSGATAKFESANNVFQTPTDFANPRTEPSGRSLILKSFLLAPIGLALIALAFAILFIPVPAITLPAAVTGRSFVENRAYEAVQNVLSSEQCVERISCELSKLSRGFEFTAWIPKTLEKHISRGQWGEKISRGMLSSQSCRQFFCHPAASLKRSFMKT